MSDTWREKVGRVLEEARKRPPEERSAFLEERCEEEALREEVASLLEAYEEGDGFFAELAEKTAASALEKLMEGGAEAVEAEAPDWKTPDPLELENSEVGRYEVEEHLGGGGMGIVYRARDVDLDRTVALKFLPPYLAASKEAERRFLREARSAAALEHPHVATVHEIGRAEEGNMEGQRYIAMAYYEGETLKEKLKREGPLPVEEALSYAEQVAEALSTAHGAGIVHRDVKPANVMVTERGEVKLLDFGLAKAVAEGELTEMGRPLGTAAYMSPEQARGEEVGPPADLWALGVLLYEMLAGERPFDGGRQAAVLHAIVHEKPTSLTECGREVPAALAQAVHRCLQKDPADRPDSAETFREDLRALRTGEGPAMQESSSTRKSRGLLGRPRWAVALAVIVLSAGLAALGWGLWPEAEEPGASGQSVAVLPFEVSGSGAETWRDGMVTVLSKGLDGAGGLRAIPDRTVLAAWEHDGGTPSETKHGVALETARRIGATYAVIGSAVEMGGELQLAADIYRTDPGRRLGSAQVRGRPDRVMALADALTRRTLAILLEKSEQSIPSVDLASQTTESLSALKAYLNGARHFRAGDYERATQDFEAAIEEDSTFALAYERLARSRAWSGASSGWREPYRRAYEFSGRLPLRGRRLVWARYTWEVKDRALTVADSLRRWTQIYPDDPSMWHQLGEVLFHSALPGGWIGAERAFEKAAGLDPGVAPYHQHLMDLAFSFHRDPTLAARRIDEHPDGAFKEVYQAFWDLSFGPPDRQEAARRRLDTLRLPSTSFPYWVRRSLSHPMDLDLQGEVSRILSAREDTDREAYAVYDAINRLRQGQLEAALPLFRQVPDWASPRCRLVASLTLGYPLSDSTLRRQLSPSRLNADASPYRWVCAGIYLIEIGQEDQIPSVVNNIRKAAARITESREEATVQSQVAIRELRGYQAWKAGNLSRASHLWSESKPPFWQWGALWRGDLYRELGKPQKALEWYRAAWTHPVAHERLGHLYEKMGRPDDAREAYWRFIEAWKDADPELQPRVEEARRRLEALGKKGA